MKELIYMDNAATTRLSDAAVSAMAPFMGDMYANPSGAYMFAYECRKMIEKCREEIAALINADADEIYFTSGGTEGDNLAIKKFIDYNNSNIAVSEIEHHAVLNSANDIKSEHVNVNMIKVDKDGKVDMEYIKHKANDFDLIGVMMANNEVGTIEPVYEIGEVLKEKRALFFCDAVQAFAHVPVDVKKMNVDILTASAHKFGGPKGVGYVYINKSRVFRPLISGGSQERGKRAGTENTAGIAGMTAAAKKAIADIKENYEKEKNLRDIIIAGLMYKLPDVKLNGHMYDRLPGNVNISFKGVDGQALLSFLDDHNICVSTASACNYKESEVSHVLKAMGVDDEYAKGTIRLTVNHENTVDEAVYVCKMIEEGVNMLRNI